MSKKGFGLRDLPQDDSDFTFGALGWLLPKLEELPEEFELDRPFPVKNQGQTDFCSAYASCGVSELQEDVELHPPYSFAASKEISGDVEAWGQNLRDAMKAHVEKYGYGGMETGVSDSTSRNLKDYPVNSKHFKKSYFLTKGQYDAYDNIRASIWKYREKKQAVVIGVIFSWSLAQYKLDTVNQNGFGHAMYVTGWTDEGLIVVNSYGVGAGKEGVHIMTREVINAFVSRFGAYQMHDIDPSDVKTQMSTRELTLASWRGKLMIIVRNYFHEIWK